MAVRAAAESPNPPPDAGDLGSTPRAIESPSIALAPSSADETSAPVAPARGDRTGTGKPICTLVGTRSEGWRWSGGGFIRWSQCAGMIAHCARAGTAEEGWYAGGGLIVLSPCARSRAR
jgi:hypothetical protein